MLNFPCDDTAYTLSTTEHSMGQVEAFQQFDQLYIPATLQQSKKYYIQEQETRASP
jgi:hypothetical protein